MALIEFGGGITKMAGKMGGNVYQNGPAGYIIKSKPTPTNPHADLQNTNRAAISEANIEWRDTLTELQRSAWAEYALNVPFQNKLGNPIYLTGLQCFLRQAIPFLANSIAYLADAPTEFTKGPLCEITAASLYESTQEITVDTVSGAYNPTDYFLIGVCLPQNGTRQVPPLHTRLLKIGMTATVIGTNFGAPWHIAVGQKVWLTIRCITADGRVSDLNYSKEGVDAAPP